MLSIKLIPVIAMGAALAGSPAAQAQPAPPILPWMPAPPFPVNATMGSYTFAPNWITSPAPSGLDARGIRATAGVDPAMAASGLPGSALGLSPNKANLLTSSSTRYRIGAGTTASPVLPSVAPGTNVGAGMEAPVLEDPGGAPPKSPSGPESAQPTSAPAVPGQPAPILEAANGKPAPATETATAPPEASAAAASSPNS